MSEHDRDHLEREDKRPVIDAGVGTAVFAVTDDPVWIALGAGMGAGLGAGLGAGRGRRR